MVLYSETPMKPCTYVVLLCLVMSCYVKNNTRNYMVLLGKVVVVGKMLGKGTSFQGLGARARARGTCDAPPRNTTSATSHLRVCTRQYVCYVLPNKI